MARFKKFFQRIPHGSYDELLVGELQSDSRVKDPEVKLRVDYVAKKSSTGFQKENSLIVTKLSTLTDLICDMSAHKLQKFEEKEAKKIARQKSQSKN